MDQEFKDNLKEQDNRATHEPIYIVYEKVKYISHKEYNNGDYDWINEDGETVGDDDDLKDYIREDFDRELDADVDLDNEDEIEVDECRFSKYYYQVIPKFVQPFFTEVGAQNYIDNNRHNLHEPYIYANSLYRNEEMISIRKYFMGDKK